MGCYVGSMLLLTCTSHMLAGSVLFQHMHRLRVPSSLPFMKLKSLASRLTLLYLSVNLLGSTVQSGASDGGRDLDCSPNFLIFLATVPHSVDTFLLYLIYSRCMKSFRSKNWCVWIVQVILEYHKIMYIQCRKKNKSQAVLTAKYTILYMYVHTEH